jgi:hypothetical protein
MCASKVDRSGVFRPLALPAPQTRLRLAPNQVSIRQNGVEFLSAHPIPLWTEVTAELRSPLDARPVRGTGVVVDCTGNRRSGYVVSLVFMNLTPQSQASLSHLASPRPA